MTTLTITICTGTACYIQGGSELLTLTESLAAETADRVVVAGSPCLNCCREKDSAVRPPFVQIGGVVYGNLDLAGLKKLVQSKLEESQ